MSKLAMMSYEVTKHGKRSSNALIVTVKGNEDAANACHLPCLEHGLQGGYLHAKSDRKTLIQLRDCLFPPL
jgi:hypothetical protein